MLQLFIDSSARWGLKVDISEDRRLNRSQWADFLANCRGTISTETGSWYLERDDKRIGRIRDYLEERRSGLVISSGSLVRKLARRLPSPVKSALWQVLKKGPIKLDVLDDFNIPFTELYNLFFRDAERAPAYGKAISSRHFDAIGTKTCQLMQRARYNDILIADAHYIAIDPDHGNADQAIERFKDPVERGRIVGAAYEHVMSAHTYRHRAEQVRAALEAV
jgi:spore maturation protein CgeB